jgi:DNA-binding beta-propeller fold protein YncE
MRAQNSWRFVAGTLIITQLGLVVTPHRVEAAAGQLANTTALTLKAADLAVHAPTGQIYASVPNSAPASANSVVTIDGATRTQTGTQPTIGDPNSLELSADGTTLYVGLNGRQSVKKFTVPGFTAGWEKSFVNDGFTSTAVAGDMEIKPDNNDYVVVSVEYPLVSPRHAGLVSLKAGDDLAERTPGHTGSNVIEFGATPTRLYGLNNDGSEFGFYRVSASPTGVSVIDTTPNLTGTTTARTSLSLMA